MKTKWGESKGISHDEYIKRVHEIDSSKENCATDPDKEYITVFKGDLIHCNKHANVI